MCVYYCYWNKIEKVWCALNLLIVSAVEGNATCVKEHETCWQKCIYRWSQSNAMKNHRVGNVCQKFSTTLFVQLLHALPISAS